MDLGDCFAIFIVIAIVLLLLFCLLLIRFNYLRKKKRNLQNLEFQTLQETNQTTKGEDYQGAYQQYCQRKSQRNRGLNENLLEKDEMLQFSFKEEIRKISNDLYGLSSLRQKLNLQADGFDSFSNYPMTALKQFSFDRIKTMETKADSKSQYIGHEFIKKLVCYSRQGIKIIEVEVQSLRKKDEKIMLKKKVKQALIQTAQPGFQDCLQTLGFEYLAYGCYKVVINVNTSALQNNSTYVLKFLQADQRKQDISLEQYQNLLNNINNSDETQAKIYH